MVKDSIQIPDAMFLAEAVGVALDSKAHIFILNPGDHPELEFNADGPFIPTFGNGSPLFTTAQGIQSPRVCRKFKAIPQACVNYSPTC